VPDGTFAIFKGGTETTKKNLYKLVFMKTANILLLQSNILTRIIMPICEQYFDHFLFIIIRI